jgi:Ca2+-binding EF-hand superfamily protein
MENPMTGITGSSLSTALLQQLQATRFQKADADASGGLSLDEFKLAGSQGAQGTSPPPPAGIPAPAIEDVFAALDTDGDSSLSLDEFSAGATVQSAGGSNLLSADAFVNLLAQAGLTAGDNNATAGVAPPPPPPSGGAQGTVEGEDSAAQVYDPLDTNQDGTVSLAELLAGQTDTAENQTQQAGPVQAGHGTADAQYEFGAFMLSLQEQSLAA